jgi:hypothetical protein
MSSSHTNVFPRRAQIYRDSNNNMAAWHSPLPVPDTGSASGTYVQAYFANSQLTYFKPFLDCQCQGPSKFNFKVTCDPPHLDLGFC